jgi:hypothetical protein
MDENYRMFRADCPIAIKLLSQQKLAAWQLAEARARLNLSPQPA